MKKLLLSFLIVSTCAIAQTYTYNPITYGAKCDGSTDDTAAFNACLQAAQNAGGGVCMVPSTVTHSCVIAQRINMQGFQGVALAGPPDVVPNTTPTLLFTAGNSWSPLINMQSTSRVSLRNLNLVYNNSGFTGTFIDLSSPSLSIMDSITDCDIQGTQGVAVGANPVINLDKAINVNIERNIMQWAVNGIVGANTSSFANVIHVRDNFFQWFSGIMMLSFGQSWTIEGNTFEMVGSSTTYPVALDGNFVGCTGCAISGNWIGDTSSTFTSWLVQGNFQGTSFAGNHIEGYARAQSASGMYIGGSGMSITGNNFFSLSIAVGIPSGGNGLITQGNSYSSVNTSVWGTPTTGVIEDLAGHPTFYGNVSVSGTLSKSAGSFRIDHPLDPKHQYLQHSFVESPDMMNVYNGVVKLGAHGEAEIKLPRYFQALNRDFRYQLTSIGAFAPVYVSQKIRNNVFRIAGGKPGDEVSWQVTGIRHDPYADTHPIITEVPKPKQDQK
jgi:hypothetical protein